ncbi:hypothetical protein [Formosa sp. PL04]|uniref:hypothetical protein n=1 Tax=Formosa sp. PL04 TaxID=3081755 RepID=UPI0029819B12|nr:hypothetical protein [Formosa sp. PL04]MDW5290027.1 hypothetical protein [Formosa sp. PL04]
MTDNIFLYRFGKMTNEELEAISFNEDVYTDEARLTALDILKSRDINTEAVIAAHDSLMAESLATKEIVVELKDATESLPPNAKSKAEALPELYSKLLILIISILFSTLFGSILLMANLKKIGQSKGRTQVLIFSLLYLFLPVILITVFNLDNNLSIFANVIGGFILTEYFWNKFIGKTFEYKRRDWAKPILISLAITIPLAYFVIKSGIAF